MSAKRHCGICCCIDRREVVCVLAESPDSKPTEGNQDTAGAKKKKNKKIRLRKLGAENTSFYGILRYPLDLGIVTNNKLSAGHEGLSKGNRMCCASVKYSIMITKIIIN